MKKIIFILFSCSLFLVTCPLIYGLDECHYTKADSTCLECHQGKAKDVSERFSSVVSEHDDLNCSECHISQPVDCVMCHSERVDEFSYSKHSRYDVKCADCHQLHQIKNISQDIEGQIETCLSCHPSQELEFKYSYTHPLRERQIKCGDCHNPHSDRYDKMLKMRDDRVCGECHADVRIEGGRHPQSKGPRHPFGTLKCMDCHRPHGSNFDKVLKHNASTLCNTCHQ